MFFIIFVEEDERKKFDNDRDLLTFALKNLSGSSDPEGMICSPEQTLNRKDLRE